MVDSVEKISNGDLSHNDGEKQELLAEADKLIFAVSNMRNSLADVISHVRNSSSQLESASQHLTEIANNNQAAAGDQQRQTEQSASAAEEQSAVAEEIARSIEQIKGRADQGSMTAEQTASAANEVSELAKAMNASVERFKL